MRSRLFKVVCITLLAILFFFVGISAPVYANKLTDQELIATAKLVQSLRAENDALRAQVNILQAGMEQSQKVVAHLNLEIQALVGAYERRAQYSDKTLEEMEKLFNQSISLTKEAEGVIRKKDSELWWWRILGIGGIAYGVGK